MARGPESISRCILHLFSRNPQALQKFFVLRMQEEWSRLPAPFCEGTAPVAFDGKTLTIHVRNAVWKQEMVFRSPDLLALVQEYWPQVGVTALRVRVGAIPPPPASPPVRVTLKQRPNLTPTPGSPGDRILRAILSELDANKEAWAQNMREIILRKLAAQDAGSGEEKN